MGIKYTRSNGPVGGQAYRDMALNLKKIIEEELRVAGKEGFEEARKFVDIAGTQAQWKTPPTFNGRLQPKRGRIDTGKMKDSLAWRVVRGINVGLDLGWISFWEEYFAAQDQGFDAPGYRKNSQTVQGMGLLAHLHIYMRARVDLALARAERRIVNGL